MRTVICGMGEVGRQLARELTENGWDVVGIDVSPVALQDVEDSLDVLMLRGDAALPTTLRKAGAGDAALVIATTGNDQVNLVATLAARELGAKFTVALLRERGYFSDRTGWEEGLLGVDLALCPGLLAGEEVVRLARTSSSGHVANFAGNLVQVLTVGLEERMAAAGKAAAQLTLPDKCRILAVVRDGSTQTAESISHLQPGDQVVVSGPTATLYEVDALFHAAGRRRGRAMVVGGGALGANVATELLKIMDSVVIADRSQQNCERLAEVLEGVQVAHGEGTSIPFLEEMDILQGRAFVAATNSDEVNLMASLLAKQLGVEQAITLLHRQDYVDVCSALGIEETVSPRLLLSSQVVRYIQRREGSVETRLPLDGNIVLELQVAERSRLVDHRLFDMDLPLGVVLAAVVRGRDLLDDPEMVKLEAGDVIVMFSPERTIRGAHRVLVGR